MSPKPSTPPTATAISIPLRSFVERGVAADRLTYRGYGESRPVADNDTPEGRAKNRRTTLTPLN